MLTGSGYVGGHLAEMMSVEQTEDTMRFLRELDAMPPLPIPEDGHRSITDTWPETHRLVYRMHLVEGFSVEDIAGCLALTEEQISASLAFARHELGAPAYKTGRLRRRMTH